VRVAARFAGPPGYANGGYIAGLLAGDGPARVTIRRPVPVERDLAFDGAALRDGDEVLVEVEPAPEVAAQSPPVGVEAARAAAARTPLADRHPFPRCFGCGPDHPSGLHCLAGELGDGSGRWAVAWTPEDGSAPFVWAALDCSSAAPVVPVGGGAPHVLGRIEAQLARPVAAGEPHVVVAWALGRDGRRKQAASALLDARGEPVAAARATWFALG
jgi:hypothetical protein